MKRKRKRGPFYAFVSAILGVLARGVYRIKIRGRENYPTEGGCLICCNHQSYMDIPALIISSPREIRFLAKAELMRTRIGKWFFGKYRVIPVHRGENDVKAIREIVAKAKEGEITAIFPQGTRRVGENPADTPILPGVGMIALRAGVPVIPVCILTKGQRFRAFQRTEVIIGKPIPYESLIPEGRPDYAAVATRIFDEVCALGGFVKTATVEQAPAAEAAEV